VSPIRWDESLETGDPVVDCQHRAIHDLFNNLEAVADNDVEIMQALDFLTEHVMVHFATEEDLMLREAFPTSLTEAHMLEHQRLNDAVRDQVLAYRSGELDSIQPIIAFLREWLVTHVRECDRQLVDHITSRGVVVQFPEAWFLAESRAAGEPPQAASRY
jgi:hemerythrin